MQSIEHDKKHNHQGGAAGTVNCVARQDQEQLQHRSKSGLKRERDVRGTAPALRLDVGLKMMKQLSDGAQKPFKDALSSV